jgi:hypothetical protein
MNTQLWPTSSADWPRSSPSPTTSLQPSRVGATLRAAPSVSHFSMLACWTRAASRSKNTYFSAKYKRIASRRGPMRAIVGVEHAMAIAAWNLLTNGDFYRDPGAGYYTARQPARTKARAVSQLETLGYRVTLEPLTQAG